MWLLCSRSLYGLSTWRTPASGGIQTTLNMAAVSTLPSHSLVSMSSTGVHMLSTTYDTMTCQLTNTRRSSTTGCLDWACPSTVAHSVTSHILSRHTTRVAAQKANLLDFMAAYTTKMVRLSLNTMVRGRMNCTGWKEILIYHRCLMPILWWRNTWRVTVAWIHRQGVPSTVDAANR